MADAPKVKQVPFLKDVKFVEADGNDEVFSPCEAGVVGSDVPQCIEVNSCEPLPQDRPITEDRILFRGEYVCADDPRLAEYLKELGLKDPTGWGPYTWRWKKEALLTFGEILGEKWLGSRAADERLTALDYVGELFDKEYPLGFFFDEEKLRDKVITMLREDYDPKVRVKAAEALGKLYAYWGRYVDHTAEDACLSAFKRESNSDVKIALLRTPFFRSADLIAAISDSSLNPSVREEAVMHLSNHIADRDKTAWNFMTHLAIEGPRELKVAALGAFVMQTYAKWSIPEGHYSLIGDSEFIMADVALPFLQSCDLQGFLNRGLWRQVKAWLVSKGVDRDMDEVAREIQI